MTRLPEVYVAAATKAGSTWLADRLREHPALHVPPEKEPHYFSDDANWARGPEWYARFHAGATPEQTLVDATPTTLMYAEALRRIGERVPGARLLAILRNPAERAYSNWRHVYFRNVTEHRPFERLVEDELREGAGLPRRDRCDRADLRHLTSGLYMDQIELALERFPREQLHVVILEDVKADASAVMAGVWRFLGLGAPPADATQRPANPHKEFRPVWLWRALVRSRALKPLPPRVGRAVARAMATTARAPEPMPAGVRARLDAYYAAPNARLAQFLGRELPGWSTT